MTTIVDSSINQYLSYFRVNLTMSAYGPVPKDWREKPSIINYNKLYLIEDGEGVIIIDDNKHYPKSGDIVFVPEGCMHSFSTISSKPYTKYWCHFNAYIGSIPLSQFFDIPPIHHVQEYNHMVELFQSLIHYEKSSSAFAPIQAQTKLMQIIYDYFVDICKGDITLKNDAFDSNIYQIIDYIEKNLHKKMTISDLAEYMRLNPSYLIRLFKSSFGITPIEYINRQKIERAKMLLTLNTDTIKSISSYLGFNTPYYFTAVFKKQTGLSPAQYRNSQKHSR